MRIGDIFPSYQFLGEYRNIYNYLGLILKFSLSTFLRLFCALREPHCGVPAVAAAQYVLSALHESAVGVVLAVPHRGSADAVPRELSVVADEPGPRALGIV